MTFYLLYKKDNIYLCLKQNWSKLLHQHCNSICFCFCLLVGNKVCKVYEQECIFIVSYFLWYSVFLVSSEGQPFAYSQNSPKYPNSRLFALNFLHDFDTWVTPKKTLLFDFLNIHSKSIIFFVSKKVPIDSPFAQTWSVTRTRFNVAHRLKRTTH